MIFVPKIPRTWVPCSPSATPRLRPSAPLRAEGPGWLSTGILCLRHKYALGRQWSTEFRWLRPSRFRPHARSQSGTAHAKLGAYYVRTFQLRLATSYLAPRWKPSCWQWNRYHRARRLVVCLACRKIDHPVRRRSLCTRAAGNEHEGFALRWRPNTPRDSVVNMSR